jgi:hypothetical protein
MASNMKQRNVGQQNMVLRDSIRQTAQRAVQKDWLRLLLATRDLSNETGILVSLTEIPEPGGNLLTGVWLTADQQFWQFRAKVSLAANELLCIEQLDDVTSSIATSAQTPGTGKSFGCLALEVLREAYS